MKLQEYLLKKADSIGALWLVFFGTLCDSVFLFIPPEVYMAPPIVANKKRAVPAVVMASIGSLVGTTIAYMIGMWLYDSVGQWIINNFSSPEQFEIARGMFVRHGMLIILIATLTPMPFKILTICAGFIGFNPLLYFGFTTITRTLRFMIIGWLLWKFQEKSNQIVKKYFWPLVFGAIVFTSLGLIMMFIM
ncbi:MAG: VTT domain-containing protein [Alphaproteobacteria bacterium]